MYLSALKPPPGSYRKRAQLWETHPSGTAAAEELIRRLGSKAKAISYLKDRVRASRGQASRTDWWAMVLRTIEGVS